MDSCKTHCITQWWFQLIKCNAGFSLWALTVFYWTVVAMKQNSVCCGENRRRWGKIMGVKVNLLRLFLEREEKKSLQKPTCLFIFYYLQVTATCGLPFTIQYFVFSSTQPSPWKANRSEHKAGSLSSSRDSAFTSPVSVTKPAVLASGSVLTSPKEVRGWVWG